MKTEKKATQKRFMGIKVSHATFKKLETLSREYDVSMSGIMRIAIAGFLKKNGGEFSAKIFEE